MDTTLSNEPLVRIRDLSKAFAGVQALASVHFELRAGEVHALMGENGAGKSTLMKVLAGVYQRDSGEIVYDGRPVEIPSPRAAQALGIQIIHQELNLMNHLTAAQNIFIGREPRGRFGLFLDEKRLNGEWFNLSAADDYPVNLGMACPKGWEALTPLAANAASPLWPALDTAANPAKLLPNSR